MKVVLISLERWDDVWRRNQHLATQLIHQRLVREVWFVEPVARAPQGMARRLVAPGITVVSPSALRPKSLGGLAAMGRRLRQLAVHDAGLLWINDPALGVHCLDPRVPTVYDVTDDWRTAGFPARIVQRIARAEDRLAIAARTIVCSSVLRERWSLRYAIDAPVVHNGIDADLWRRATPRDLSGEPPHVGYVGTLHAHRLDVALLDDLAVRKDIGTIHLIGPNLLRAEATERLSRHPKIMIHGAVPASEVPSWMLGMDVLISPHLVNDFTLSLDAIKAYEYAAAGKPVVATPTSGFTSSTTTYVVPRVDFVAACAGACRRRSEAARDVATTTTRDIEPEAARSLSWAVRAQEFWDQCLPATSNVDSKESTHA